MLCRVCTDGLKLKTPDIAFIISLILNLLQPPTAAKMQHQFSAAQPSGGAAGKNMLTVKDAARGSGSFHGRRTFVAADINYSIAFLG